MSGLFGCPEVRNAFDSITPGTRSIHGLVLLGLLFVARPSLPATSGPALVAYAASGGGLNGSFAGALFSGAVWSVSATGETANNQTILVSEILPLNYTDVTPVVSITGWFQPMDSRVAWWGGLSWIALL